MEPRLPRFHPRQSSPLTRIRSPDRTGGRRCSIRLVSCSAAVRPLGIPSKWMRATRVPDARKSVPIIRARTPPLVPQACRTVGIEFRTSRGARQVAAMSDGVIWRRKGSRLRPSGRWGSVVQCRCAAAFRARGRLRPLPRWAGRGDPASLKMRARAHRACHRASPGRSSPAYWSRFVRRSAGSPLPRADRRAG